MERKKLSLPQEDLYLYYLLRYFKVDLLDRLRGGVISYCSVQHLSIITQPLTIVIKIEAQSICANKMQP